MKLATVLTVVFAAASLDSQAGGVLFDMPVTYTEPVTYAAGVTYLAPVTYAPGVAATAQATAAATPVLLERIIVTPSRTYAEREWHVHLADKRDGAQFYPVRSERRTETRAGSSALRILLTLQ